MSRKPPTRIQQRFPWSPRDPAALYRVGFLLVPNFTLIGLGSAVDPLRIANMVAKRPMYEFATISEDGQSVLSSDGIRVDPAYSIANAPDFDAVLVVGPNPIPKKGLEKVMRWLRRAADDGLALGGVDTGSYLLARANLLDGYRCTIHWEDMGELVESFPRLKVSTNLFEIDRDRCTCSGGIAAVDMMIHLISLGQGGRTLAASVSELLVCEHRGPEERQRVPLRSLIGSGNQRLSEVVALMEANIEEPLKIDELAVHSQLSPRQLERLFRDHLQCTPSQYYLRLRLNRAHHLLRRTNQKIADVAAACGFVSLAHFTTRFGSAFGVTPRLARRQFAE